MSLIIDTVMYVSLKRLIIHKMVFVFILIPGKAILKSAEHVSDMDADYNPKQYLDF